MLGLGTAVKSICFQALKYQLTPIYSYNSRRSDALSPPPAPGMYGQAKHPCKFLKVVLVLGE